MNFPLRTLESTTPKTWTFCTASAILSQFSDVVSAVFPSCFTDADSPLRLNIPDAAVMRFAADCKPTTPGGKLRVEDELRFFGVIREQITAP